MAVLEPVDPFQRGVSTVSKVRQGSLRITVDDLGRYLKLAEGIGLAANSV